MDTSADITHIGCVKVKVQGRARNYDFVFLGKVLMINICNQENTLQSLSKGQSENMF